MIYELTTYDLRHHSVEEVERRMAHAYEARRKLSGMSGSFHTEIGPLNQIVQIWPYKNQAERDQINREAAGSREWPPDISEFVVKQTTYTFTPFDFSPVPEPGAIGPYFELRWYTYAEGDRPRIAKTWEAALPERRRQSPLVFIATCEEGETRCLAHIWAYSSLDQRSDVRRTIRAGGSWPPHVLAKQHGWPPYTLVKMENRIMLPSPCSPLQ